MPNWTEISCRVRDVRIDRGRRGVLDMFEPGRAGITVANPDGWATWSPTSPGPLAVGAWLRVRADDDVLFTGAVLRVLDAYTPTGELAAELVCVDPLARLGQVELPPRVPEGAGDTAAERIGRVLDEVRVAAELRDLDPGGPVLTATTMEGSMADQAQRAAATAGGHLFADRDGRICYRDAGWLRTHPRSTTPVAVISNEPGTTPVADPTDLTWGTQELVWGTQELTWGPATTVDVPHLCATGIQANGPDMERLWNLVTYSGIDDALPDLEPVEVTQRDGPSGSRYGWSSFNVDRLYTRDPAQLAVLGSRALALRSQPRVWIDTLDLSPVADPNASELCATVEFGDRLQVAYRHPLGWGWETEVHVHGIGYRLLPSGERNEVAEWTTTLILDDAAYWVPGEAWDYSTWDEGTWSAPARTLERAA
jgi:hypothetical protein